MARSDCAIAAALVVLASLLVFPSLGATSLWNDEAETGLMARSILATGLPRVQVGPNLVTSTVDQSDHRDGLLIWRTWLPFYLAAGSMAVLGDDAFGGRFPFALAFVILVLASWRFSARHLDRTGALLAALLVLTSVPLLLHARQCRYFILVPLLVLLATDAWLRLASEGRTRSLVALVVWLTALFHAYYPATAFLGVAFGLEALARRDRPGLLRLALAGSFLVVLNLPAVFYFRIWSRGFGVQPAYTDVAVFGAYLVRYAVTLAAYGFPFVVLLLGGIVGWSGREAWRRQRVLGVAATVCLVFLLGVAAISHYPFTRYAIGVFPLLMFLGVRATSSLARGRTWLAVALVAVIGLTNALHVLPLRLLRPAFRGVGWSTAGVSGRYVDREAVGVSYARGETSLLIETPVEIPLVAYLRSLATPSRGPVDELVDYLREHAEPDDVIKISYGDMPLMFHLPNSVVPATLVGPSQPDWIIDRHFNPMAVNQAFLDDLRRADYALVRLRFPDVQWNNRPDPLYHVYGRPAQGEAPPIRILRKDGG